MVRIDSRSILTAVATAIVALMAAMAIAHAQAPLPPPRPPEFRRALPPSEPSPAAAPATAAQPQPTAQTPASQPQPTGQSASAAQAPTADMESGEGQPTQSRCVAYRDAFDAALTRFGRNGLSAEFIERSNAFVASNCAGERNVCPRSTEELRIANIIIMRAVGTTGGTFMPFACKKEEAAK